MKCVQFIGGDVVNIGTVQIFSISGTSIHLVFADATTKDYDYSDGDVVQSMYLALQAIMSLPQSDGFFMVDAYQPSFCITSSDGGGNIGDSCTINGRGFDASCTVGIGDSTIAVGAASVTFVSETELSFIIPAHDGFPSAVAQDLVVNRVSDGKRAVQSGGFTWAD